MSRSTEKSKSLRVYEHVLITGASGGIGSALARFYAKKSAHISLWGRDRVRLDDIAHECAALGAIPHVLALDLSDASTALNALDEAEFIAPLDVVFFNAGVSDIRQSGELFESPETVEETMRVNLVVPTSMASAAANRMARRRRGSIVFTGSVAAWHDLPFAASYSASKSGLERFSGALRAAMVPHNVNVTLIGLGFVDTPMSRRLAGFKPFMVSADAVVSVMVSAIHRRKGHVVFPRIFNALRLLELLLPRWAVHFILRRIHVSQSPRQGFMIDASKLG